MPRQLYISEPYRIEIREEPRAELEADQARVKMLYSGISHGTEMNVYRGRSSWEFPVRSGYSAVGEVVEVGADLTKAKVGDLVFHYAAHGSEFMLPESGPVYPVPEGVDPKSAVIAALAGVAYNGVLESRTALGETAVVFGLGVVGLCASFQVRRAGAFRVIGVDPLPLRREAALNMGVDATIDPAAGDIQEQVKAANGGEWADVIIETSGAIAALNDALKVIKNQSTIVALSWYSGDGSGLDLSRDFHFRRVNLRVAQASSVPVELSPRWTHERKFRSALSLMPEMPLDSLVTHTFPFEEAGKAYELVDKHPEECIQVVLEY